MKKVDRKQLVEQTKQSSGPKRKLGAHPLKVSFKPKPARRSRRARR